MRRLTRWGLFAVAAVVLLTAAATAALPRLVDTRRAQSLIATGASQALARPVKFQSVSVSVFPYPSVRLARLEVAEDPGFGGAAFLSLDDADLRLKLWPLLRGRVEFATLVLKRPTIALIRGSDGRWNVASLGPTREGAVAARPSRGGGATASPATLVSRVVIDEGLVTYETRPAAGRAASPGRLEKVSGTLVARGGGFAFDGSARAMPGDVRLEITGGSLGVGAARTLSEATVRARVALDARDVRPLAAAVMGTEPEVTGAMTGRFDVAGTVGRPRASGEIEIQGPEVTRTSPECPEPRRRKLALATIKAGVSWADGRLLVEPLTTGIGSGGVTTKVRAMGAPPTQAELSDVVLRGVQLERVLVDFLCGGYAVTGPLDLTGNFALTLADPLRSLSGAGRLSVGRGRVVGPRALALVGGLLRVSGGVSSALSLDVPSDVLSSPLDFDAVTATFQVRNGVATTGDLLYTSRSMKVRVAGDYVLPTAEVSADVVVDHGRGLLQARVTGPAASPAVRLAPGPIARRIDSQRVERSLEDLLKKFR